MLLRRSTEAHLLEFGRDATAPRWPLTIRRHPRARRMTLRIDPSVSAVVLTVGTRTPLAPALNFVERHRGWIEAQIAKVPPVQPVAPGGTLAFEGRERAIRWDPALPRRVQLHDDVLSLGGPQESVQRRVIDWLKSEAREILSAETHAMAARAGLTVRSVSIGDPRGRWGSCSVNGDIRYSWRLIMAPVFVRRSTVAHELAHRVHMDHSAAFHRTAAMILGDDPKPARHWLRREGAALHRVGRGS